MRIIILICILCLCGCAYNLTDYVPTNEEFLTVIESLDTPEKIVKYMSENFTYKLNWFAYSPYQMWLLNTQDKYGDCNDYSTWAIFVAHYHGYEVYQIIISASYGLHALGVFVEDGYSYSDVWIYHPIHAKTFQCLVNHHIETRGATLNSYKVYDYDMNLVKGGK